MSTRSNRNPVYERGSGIYYIRYSDAMHRIRRERVTWKKLQEAKVKVDEAVKLREPGKELAEKLLNKRRAVSDEGEKIPALHTRRLTVEDLAQAVFVDHQVQGKKDQLNPRLRWEKHLKPVFGHVRASDVTRPQIDRYVAARLGAKASNATIMRELAFLKRAFCLGVEHEQITRVPTFPRLEENNVREGFPTDEQFEKLKQACAAEGLWLRAMMEVSATYGWRKSALLRMRVQSVDLLANTIRQEGSTTKNGEAVECKLVPDLRHLLTACMIGKRPEDFLFTREGNRPVRVFRDEWELATQAAGAPHLLFHDLCRFAARGLDNAGISQKVGMEMMGRKTPSIYFRYRIVNRKDKDAGVDKLVEYLEYRRQQRVSLAATDFSGLAHTDTSTDTSAQGTGRSEMKSVVIE